MRELNNLIILFKAEERTLILNENHVFWFYGIASKLFSYKKSSLD